MANTERDELTELRAQLRELRRECERSAGMTADVIAAFGEAFRRDRRMLRKESEAVGADVLSLEKDHAVLPLGIKAQRVAVGSFESARRVSATALCADASEVVTLRLTFESFEAERVRDVIGDRLDEPSTGCTTFLVRLIAGEPKDLFEVVPQTEAVEFEVCRVGGEPCIVRLQIAGLAAGAPVTTAAKGQSGPSLASPARRRDRTSSKGTLWKAQELLREGRPERAMQIALAYATDIERPALSLLRAAAAADDDEWLANVNAYVEQFGIAPIRLDNTNASRFLRLAADRAADSLRRSVGHGDHAGLQRGEDARARRRFDTEAELDRARADHRGRLQLRRHGRDSATHRASRSAREGSPKQSERRTIRLEEHRVVDGTGCVHYVP